MKSTFDKKNTVKKLTAILLLVSVITLMTPVASFAAIIDAKSVTLDVSQQRTGFAKGTLTQERSLGDDVMIYQIPSQWKTVESRLEDIEGYCYKLNEIKGHEKNDCEQLYVFYFDNEKYLLNQTDAGNREGIEKGIVKNIFPNVNFIKFNIAGFTFPTARIGKDGAYTTPTYDYFDTNYRDKNGTIHNAEFVFLQHGTKGIFCALYIYTDSVHRDDIVALLRSFATRK